ncbi:MAG: DUF1963 domain-containing protein [Pseudomonadota bacterium]
MKWIKRIFKGRGVYQNDELIAKSGDAGKSTRFELPFEITKENWRDYLIRMASPIEVGGFRPTQSPIASVFGDVRVALKGEKWPSFEDLLLWPLCQFNLTDAPLLPEELSDIKFISIFVHPDIIPKAHDIIDTSDTETPKPMVIRVYKDLSDLVEIERPSMEVPLKPFEVKWLEPVPDYPNHDCLPFNFDLLQIGDYYDQTDIENVQATKFGGYPGTVQSEPWWDYKSNEYDFEFVLQIESEPKSNWGWGDGAAFLARSKKNPQLWALDIQFT